MRCLAIIPAAGSGSRFGGSIPKQYVELHGVPILVRTVERLLEFAPVARVVVCVAPDQITRVEDLRSERSWKMVSVVPGGESRQESVRLGLAASEGDPRALVAVHDAVRPFVSSSLFLRTLEAADEFGAALPLMHLNDTIHRVRDGFVFETPDRSEWFAGQTPQCFRRALLQRALDVAARDGVQATDEAAAVGRTGVAVRVVEGEARNFKITREDDLRIAEANFERWMEEA